MDKPGEERNAHTVEIEFNQQQEIILKELARDGKYGKDYSDIIRNVFQEFLRQTRL